uniref:Uncharacterized protein n=1 Tax=Caenorhabditis japonica TaxID=281687 RepID=A0A8R1DNP9_CAEJA
MEKQSSRAAAARDVLLDGSESRLHEKSLLGELKMALEPRRSDFAKRERKALAKFYGIGEKELMKKEENAGKKEEVNDFCGSEKLIFFAQNFEGLGLGDQEDPEPYDWRKDAENSAGIHQEADNLDFLNALASRRVADDVIE